jgi:hypothetical protein
MALTDTFVKNSKYSGKSAGDKHSDGQGLYLHVVKHVMHIDDMLSNLRYVHIVILSAACSILNGVVHNAVYVWQDKVKLEDFFSDAAAMVLGDFLGCFIVIVFFNVCVDLAFRTVDRERRTDQGSVRLMARFLARPKT